MTAKALCDGDGGGAQLISAARGCWFVVVVVVVFLWSCAVLTPQICIQRWLHTNQFPTHSGVLLDVIVHYHCVDSLHLNKIMCLMWDWRAGEKSQQTIFPVSSEVLLCHLAHFHSAGNWWCFFLLLNVSDKECVSVDKHRVRIKQVFLLARHGWGSPEALVSLEWDPLTHYSLSRCVVHTSNPPLTLYSVI